MYADIGVEANFPFFLQALSHFLMNETKQQSTQEMIFFFSRICIYVRMLLNYLVKSEALLAFVFCILYNGIIQFEKFLLLHRICGCDKGRR